MMSLGALSVVGVFLTLTLLVSATPQPPSFYVSKGSTQNSPAFNSLADSLSGEWAAYEGINKHQAKAVDVRPLHEGSLATSAASRVQTDVKNVKQPKVDHAAAVQSPSPVSSPVVKSSDSVKADTPSKLVPKHTAEKTVHQQKTVRSASKQKAALHSASTVAKLSVSKPSAKAPHQNDQISAHAARVTGTHLTDEWLKYEGLSNKQSDDQSDKNPSKLANKNVEGLEGNEVQEEQQFNARDAAQTLQNYVQDHPGFAASAATWLVIGLLLFIGSCVVLLISEIRVMLVVRDQDFRANMLKDGYMQKADNIEKLEEREQNSQAARPYVTGTCMVVLFVAIVCILKPFCNVLDIIGLPSSNCFLTVAFGGFVGSVVITTMTMGLVWSCTRGWAAFVLLSIALSGSLLCPTGIPFLVVLWMILSLCLFLYYFVYLPDQAEELPHWCQTIGPLKASMDPEEWKAAASKSAAAGKEDWEQGWKTLTASIAGPSKDEPMSSPAANAPDVEGQDGNVDKKRNTASV